MHTSNKSEISYSCLVILTNLWYHHNICKLNKENDPYATNWQQITVISSAKISNKKKISCDSAEIWYGGGNLALICAYQISAKSGTKKFLLCLLWLLKPQMNVPLLWSNDNESVSSDKTKANFAKSPFPLQKSNSFWFSLAHELLSSPGPKPFSPKPKTKGPWADTKLLQATTHHHHHPPPNF